MPESYVDVIMKNYPLVTDSSINELSVMSSKDIKPSKKTKKGKSKKSKKKQSGGASSSITQGSFPPLYIITAEEKQKEEENKNRTFGAPDKKSTVSIKEIMEQRRDEKKPFISF